MAADTDSLAIAEHKRLQHDMPGGKSGNPALKVDFYRLSYSEILADFSYRNANTPLLYQTGKVPCSVLSKPTPI
ncbi:MAG: hypothetical protein LUC45_02315 [Paraprevotella sp.]|nr:hypothetical protein [Paraprevotella sp.]